MEAVPFPAAEGRRQDSPALKQFLRCRPSMKARTAVPIVDTNIIPDRNAGMGSLLWDLQNPQEPDRDGPPLLCPGFAFIDVGATRARTSAALKTLLARDLGMDVTYVATELPEVVPFAYVTPLGDRGEEIRRSLSTMISSMETTREVIDWHYVVDRRGRVSSVAYSYRHHGNEVWEAYYMGRAFLVSGELVEFSDPTLEAMLAPDVATIEAAIELESEQASAPSQPAPSWNGYWVERDPLTAGLAEFGITLQVTELPQRLEDRQNVLFLGNVLNHYPQAERSRVLDRVAANMQEGDLVIVQADEMEASFVEVLHVRGQGARKTRERVRWIDTRTLEVQRPVRGSGTWQRVCLKPELERMADRLVDFLGKTVRSAEWSHEAQQGLVRRQIRHVFGTYFRALPVQATLRIAVREVLRRLPSEGDTEGIPVFKEDAEAALGGALGAGERPIVSEAVPVCLGLDNPQRSVDWGPGSRRPRDRFDES